MPTPIPAKSNKYFLKKLARKLPKNKRKQNTVGLDTIAEQSVDEEVQKPLDPFEKWIAENESKAPPELIAKAKKDREFKEKKNQLHAMLRA